MSYTTQMDAARKGIFTKKCSACVNMKIFGKKN